MSRRCVRSPLRIVLALGLMISLPAKAATDLLCTSVNTEIRGFTNRFTLAHDATWLVGSDGTPPYILACLPGRQAVVCSGKDILVTADREHKTLTVVTFRGSEPVKLLYNCKVE